MYNTCNAPRTTGVGRVGARDFYKGDQYHHIDACCISGNQLAVSNGEVYYQKKVRCHNRQIHKNTVLKGGCRKRNQAPYMERPGMLYFRQTFYRKNGPAFIRRDKAQCIRRA